MSFLFLDPKKKRERKKKKRTKFRYIRSTSSRVIRRATRAAAMIAPVEVPTTRSKASTSGLRRSSGPSRDCRARSSLRVASPFMPPPSMASTRGRRSGGRTRREEGSRAEWKP